MTVDATALLVMLLKNQAMLETIYETQSHIIAKLEERDQEEVYAEMIEKHEHIEQELMKLYREAIPGALGSTIPQGEA